LKPGSYLMIIVGHTTWTGMEAKALVRLSAIMDYLDFCLRGDAF